MGPFTRHKHHRREEHHGADHGEKDRLEDLPHTRKGRAFALYSPALCSVNRFTDDNRVVHNNAQHEQKGKQRDHVEAHAGVRQQEERAEECDGDTH